MYVAGGVARPLVYRSAIHAGPSVDGEVEDEAVLDVDIWMDRSKSVKVGSALNEVVD